ncbi:MAG TPA: hypothetical protein VMR76_01890 [Candidatus Saccharimonadia bacterium]|nr:hypothetical protein [Candidatus Saccharimonadia bacterium]
MFLLNFQTTFAAIELINRSITLSNSSESATSNYLMQFNFSNTSTPVEVVQVKFCSNSPIPSDPCISPTGMDTTAAILNQQTGNIGFTLDNTLNGTLKLSRSPSVPDGSLNSYEFTNIINPSFTGQYYARIATYATGDTTLPPVETGGIALDIVPNLTINAVVPPYITFCLASNFPYFNCSSGSGSQLNLGNFQTYSSSSGSYQFLVATNEPDGYSISVNGTTLTSGNNIIPALSVFSPPQYGVSQFGINLVKNTLPSVGQNPVGDISSQPFPNYAHANSFLFNSGDIIAGSSQNSNFTIFTNSVMVNINNSQPAGVYSTTLTYIAFANF